MDRESLCHLVSRVFTEKKEGRRLEGGGQERDDMQSRHSVSIHKSEEMCMTALRSSLKSLLYV